MQLHGVDVEQIDRLEDDVIAVVIEHGGSHDSALGRRRDRQRSIERELSRRLRQYETEGTGPGIDDGIGISQRRDAADLDVPRTALNHDAPTQRS